MEDAARLDASAVVRAIKRQHPALWERWSSTGEAVLVPVAVPLVRDGRPADEINLVLALDGTGGAAGFPGGAWAPLSARLAAPPGAGAGFRWSWRCPELGHRCEALFLPPGQAEFLSRQAHGLRHRSACDGRMARLARRARKLRRRLGESPAVIGAPWPARPPRMAERTYARLLDRLRVAENRALAVMAGLVPARRASGW